MDRKREREFHKNRRSEKWKSFNKVFKQHVKVEKHEFYRKITKDLLGKNSSQWYSSLKRMTNFDQQKKEKVIIQEINHLSDTDQASKLADKFS